MSFLKISQDGCVIPTARPVNTKRDFVKRYSKGEFGNHSPTWETLEELVRIDNLVSKQQLFHLRNRRLGSTTHYNLDYMEAVTKWTRMPKPERRLWYCSAMAPHHLNVLQGEVRRGVKGLELYCSKALNKPMRQALAEEGEMIYGLNAVRTLHSALNDPSYYWLNLLLDRYEDHVVEFSAFSQCWGTIPGYNTVFWEVRNY